MKGQTLYLMFVPISAKLILNSHWAFFFSCTCNIDFEASGISIQVLQSGYHDWQVNFQIKTLLISRQTCAKKFFNKHSSWTCVGVQFFHTFDMDSWFKITFPKKMNWILRFAIDHKIGLLWNDTFLACGLISSNSMSF